MHVPTNALIDHIKSILNITIGGVKIFEKTMIIFAPEANTAYEHQRYKEDIQAYFKRNTIISILEAKERNGIMTTQKVKAEFANQTVLKLKKKRISFSTSFFTNTMKNQIDDIKYTPKEMINIMCDQLSKFERRHIPNKDPEKAGSVIYSGKGANSRDDFAIALMLNCYAIYKFRNDDKYKTYRNR
jgi:hypothetical protein